jgi:hypothetical protein
MQREYKCVLRKATRFWGERGEVAAMFVSRLRGDSSMTSIRKLLGLFATIALMAFAIPGIAADKLFLLSAKVYTLTGTSNSGVIPAGTTSIVLLDYANQSPNGANSVMKSVAVDIPSDISYKVLSSSTSVNTSPSKPTVSCPAPPTFSTPPTGLTGPGGTLNINNITGVKPQGHYCLYLAVTTSLQSCTLETWKGYANTGNSIAGGTPFLDFNVDSPNQDQPYSLATTSDGCTGILGCGSTPGDNIGGHLGSLVLNQSGFEGTADWGIVRGNNWNNTACTLVPYQFNFDGSQGVASFIVDNGAKGSQAISVEYVLLFDPVPLATWPTFHPKVAWGSTFGVGGATPSYSQDYVPVLPCLDDDVNGVNVLPDIPSGAQDFATDYATAAAAGTGNPQYATPGKAMMCVANTGWTAIQNPVGFPPGSYIQPWFKIIDRSDGYTHI